MMNKSTKFIAVICGLVLTMVFSVNFTNAVNFKNQNTSSNIPGLNTIITMNVDTIRCTGDGTICFTEGGRVVYGNYLEY